MTAARVVSTFVCVFAGAVASWGCADERPPIVWEGEHLRFGTHEDIGTICGGTLPYSDDLVPHLAAVFDEPVPTFDFYWVPGGAGDYCGSEGALGCSPLGRAEAFSEYVLSQHEIVHGIRSSAAYRPFEEGIAELYGDDWNWIHDAKPSWIPEIYAKNQESGAGNGPGWYPTVGHFASYLRTTAGADTFLELAAASSRGDSFEKTKAKFDAAYGVPFDELADDYAQIYPVCDHTTYRDDAFDCDRNVVQAPGVDDEKLDLEISLECDDPQVLGPRLGERWTTITLEVATKADYALSVGPKESEIVRTDQVRVRKCGSSCFDEPGRIHDEQILLGGDSFCLEPGRYTFRLSLHDDESSVFRFMVWPAHPGQNCS